jgi:hypothetical protein
VSKLRRATKLGENGYSRREKDDIMTMAPSGGHCGDAIAKAKNVQKGSGEYVHCFTSQGKNI